MNGIGTISIFFQLFFFQYIQVIISYLIKQLIHILGPVNQGGSIEIKN